MLNLTKEEKTVLAQRLREPKNLPFTAPEGYLDCVDEVNRREFKIPVSDGEEITVWLTETEEKLPCSMLFINIHGGGFVQKHAIWDHALCAVMARELRCSVLDVDYRLAPEYPFPTAINDCYDAFRWAYGHAKELGIDREKIVVGGNSAGGTLTAAVCMKAAEHRVPGPAMAVMIYPAGAMEETEGIVPDENLNLGDLGVRSIIYNNLYLESDDQTKNPYVSLIYAAPHMLESFPDTVVVTAGQDILCAGGEEFARKLAVSGSKITLQRFKNSNHGFYLRCIGDEWQKARNMVFDEIRFKMGIERK